MTGALVIDPRFCGPPGIGNGGYVCALVAACADGPVAVTLRRPAPLATVLAVERAEDGSVRVLDGQVLVAEAAPQAGPLTMELPGPVSVDEASAAAARCRFRASPGDHPFPTCFGCGPARRPGDGLRIMVGPATGRGLCADVWYPGQDLADSGGQVKPEFWWAALDCAGGFGTFADAPEGGPLAMLGRFSARHLGPVMAGEPLVVAGWRIGGKGRVTMAGSALYTAAGDAVAMAQAVWVSLR